MGFKIDRVEKKTNKFVMPYSADFEIDKTLITMLPEWLRNFETNRETMDIKHTIHDLPKIKDSALIVDHSFTGSFENQVEDLKEYKGTIFACDRALLRLIQCDIIPDYVVNVDSSYLCVSFFDQPEIREHMNEITAIFAATTFPLTVRTWTGKRVFFTPRLLDFDQLTESISALSRTDIVRPGGCVHNTSWAIAYALGAKTIGLYGIDNSYNSPSQSEEARAKLMKCFVHELNKSFYTDSVYKIYAEILFRWIEYTKGEVSTVNTTENGIMYDSIAKKMGYDINIKKKTLKEFVGKNKWEKRKN